MAQSEDESKDGDALEAHAKRGGDSPDDLVMFKRRRAVGSPLPEEAGSVQPPQEEEAAGGAAAFSFEETQQTGGDAASLDDSLMALLLPDGLGAADASGLPSDQPPASSTDNNSSSSSSRGGGGGDLLPCFCCVCGSRRVMVTGAQSEDAALRAARLLVKMLQAIFCPSSTAGGPPSRQPALSFQQRGGEGPPEGAGSERGGPLALPSAPGAPSPAEDQLALVNDGNAKGVKEAETEPPVAAGGEGADKQGGEELSVIAPKETHHLPPPISSLSKRSFTNIQLTEFAIENIVATADCGLPVRLEGLAFDHKEFCSYEPELFAGLVYRYNPTPSLKAVLLIFVSGKVVITGCRTTAEIREVFNSFFPVLLKYHT
ncbi:LOW QUALITY PROTEIN: TATA-box binding protein, putative [Eimeria mitis]|uniref:TATA-box binding protein, putative n=1 Tax=Eimeria mitis TaxID=44415 RepID=U6KII1_9EIME|nr:LOW QUALITY PROTEIN: TATA-box binding protein, putative [Eimeria mitis]CDJ36062.1 TATA-box binding protein, putative [Eimeria mitis]